MVRGKVRTAHPTGIRNEELGIGNRSKNKKDANKSVQSVKFVTESVSELIFSSTR